MSSTAAAEEILNDFRHSFGSSKPDLVKAKSLLSKLKIELTKFSLLPPFSGNPSTTKQQLLIARETFENACLLSLVLKDIPGFIRHLNQLKVYYTDFASILPSSSHQASLLGLYLLSLLAHNQLADFHTELELLSHSSKDLVKTSDIQFAIRVEQQLMEGCYNQVLASSGASSSSSPSSSSAASRSSSIGLPHPSSSLFMEMLSVTVREKIGECSEQAYKRLGLKEAQQLLMFTSEKDLREFVSKHSNWHIDERDGVIVFSRADGEATHIPALNTIAQTLHYATEMEKIV